jgi:hypothetical protein
MEETELYTRLSNYDARIINVSENKLLKYYNLLTENLGPNEVLKKLIQNHYKDTMPISFELSGPCSLSLHKSNIYNKTIYIFGELHGNENSCTKKCNDDKILYKNQCVSTTSKKGKNLLKQGHKIYKEYSIENYLGQLFNNTSVFIDFFLEISKTPILSDDPASYLVKIQNKFIDCWTGSSYNLIPEPEENDNLFTAKKSPLGVLNSDVCKLTRMHYIDVRRDINLYDTWNSSNDLGILVDILNRLSNSLYHDINMIFKENRYSYITKTRFLNILRKLSGSKKVYKEYIFDIFKNKIVKKELKKSIIKKKIDTFFSKKISILSSNYRKQIKNVCIDLIYIIENKLPSSYSNLYSDYFDVVNNYLILLEALIMDVYTISRIFKRFDIKSGILQPSEVSNIIIYTGEAHSDIYREFLVYIGFDTINYIQNENENERCLNISSFQQPFFV